MKTKLTTLLTLCFSAAAVLAQSSAFTYQGRLNDGASPANGIYDLRFAIYDAITSGNALGGPLTNPATAISGGLFTIALDFGAGVFTGADRWLEIAVRPTGGGAFAALSPRQALTATPHALYAQNAGTAATAVSVAAAAITGTLPLSKLPSAVVTNGAAGLSLSGSFTGNGGGLTNVPGTMPWQTVAGANVTTAPNRGYLLTDNALNLITLPANASVGDIVALSGAGSNGWQVGDGNGQTILGYLIPGLSWTARNSDRTNWQAIASSADGTKLAAAAYDGPIYTSTNSGVTWTAQNSGSHGWISLASSADGAKLVAADFGPGLLYTSTDSGVTWTAVTSVDREWLSVASSADGTKLVACMRGGQIHTSTNSGGTWIEQNSGVRQWYGVASSADGTKLVACVRDGQIYTSTNSGVTWTEQNSGSRPWYPVVSSADGTKLVAAEYADGGLIYHSTNSGVTWTSEGSPSGKWGSLASSADGRKLVAGLEEGPIYTSIDSGKTWTAQNSGSNLWYSMASSADGTKLVAGAYEGQIHTSGLSPAFAGGAGATAQLQYLGHGLWQPMVVAPGNLPANLIRSNSVDVTLSGAFSGDGSGLTALNASSLASGTVADARLSPNVALLARNQTFSGANTFANAGNSFTGNGAGLTSLNAANLTTGTVPNARLSTNVALYNANQTFSGRIGIRTNHNADDALSLGDTLRLNDYNLWFRSGSDANHGLGWYGSGKTFASQSPDGPVLFGYDGGLLGTARNGAEQAALKWTFNSVTAYGTFNNLSDRNAKQDFAPVSTAEVLEKVAQLPLSTWSYKSDPATRHLGPTAQDFSAAFQVGTDERHIAPIDEGGVTLAAIQALNEKVETQSQDAETSVQKLRTENAELKARLERLERLVRPGR